MVVPASRLVALVRLVDRVPLPSPPPQRPRGHPLVYSDRLFLKALVIMVLRRLSRVHELWSTLIQQTPDMRRLRAVLAEHGRFPSRRTFERRLAAIPQTMPAQIALLGQLLLDRIQPWQCGGRAVSLDSTPLHAVGKVWHRRERQRGVVPDTRIDTEAHWTRSGWHGWVYGWKLHLAATVGPVWVPLAARLTPANAADNVVARELLAELPEEVGVVLGDAAYDDPLLRQQCEEQGWALVTTRRGPHPHQDAGVEVRRVFHQLRTHAIENWNGQFKSIFALRDAVPTKGWRATARWLLGAVWVYQRGLLLRLKQGADLRLGLKPFLRAA